MGWNENGDVWFANTTMGVRNSADVFNRFRLGGSSVHQLATWLKEVGATQAVMLDGGGSTTMYRLTETGSYKRVELPASEWVRVVPQGLGMVQR
jgi:ABC-type Fe3+ transport system substrate-binding protein